MNLVKKYTPLILFIGLVALVILNASSFISGAISLFDVISTLIYGAVIAFVLNVPMKKIEQYLVKLKVKAELRRPIAMVLVFLALILIVIALLVLVLPTLAQTISQLGTVLSTVLTQLGKLLGSSEFVTKDMLSTIVSGIQGQSSSISQALIGFLSGLTSNIGNIFSSLMNAFLIIVFTFLFLSCISVIPINLFHGDFIYDIGLFIDTQKPNQRTNPFVLAKISEVLRNILGGA